MRRASLVLGLAIAAIASALPASARDHGRGRAAYGDGPSSLIPRRLIGPLRDAVRTIERGVDEQPYPETDPAMPDERSEARTQRRVAPIEESEAPADPAPPKTVALPAPREPAAEPAPSAAQIDEPEAAPIEPARAASHRAPLLLAALAVVGVALGLAHSMRRARRDSPLASATTVPLAASAGLAATRARGSDAAERPTRPRVEPAAGLEADPRAPTARDLAPSEITKVRRADPSPGVATGIEEIRKRESAASAVTVPRVAASPASPFPPTGRYEILEELGRGGMGVVYRARDTRLDRVVALKRLSDHLRDHPRAVALLLQEARSAARLNHPNIVTVYDVDHDEGAYFITMELMEGQPLNAVLQQRGKLTPKAAAWVGQHAATGLAYAHERRIVHRDIKTANLFVTRDRALKIMDFGLAKMVEEVRKRASLIAGTPSYMAPEQAQGIEVDGRADLYALGVTLFELTTGRLPFEDGDPVHHHRNTAPPDPREWERSIPDAFAGLVLQLLAKQPEGRPASAAEVAAQLRAIERDRAA